MDQLALVCEELAKYSGRLRKVAVLSAYFKPLSDDDLLRAVRFLCGRPVAALPTTGTMFGRSESKTLSVGYSALREALLVVSGWDAETVGLCHREVGDGGETIALLIGGKTKDLPLTLAAAEEIYLSLFRTRKTAEKVAILTESFSTYRPLAIKYFVKIIGGNLRIGLQEKMVEEAVAAATGLKHQAVREANNRLGDLAQVALAARRDELHAIEARLFHPMDFMLAKPLDSLDDLKDPGEWIVEDKYDGIRSQAHIADGQVHIYSRGMEEVTGAYPEVAEAMKNLPGSTILDGELLAWRDGRAMAFTMLQQRLARKKVSPDLIAAIPVAFMAYDILYRDGMLLLDTPIEERRALLEAALTDQPLPMLLSPQLVASTHEEFDRTFDEARLRGNEGLLLKHRGSAYEPGRRSGTWLKVKRAYGTLDVVITAAEQGHGKRATVLSDYTFAVRDGERYLNVGKAYSGLTDVEIKEMTKLLRGLSTDKFGRVMLVKPEIVLEVGFDGVQKSPRHKSGFALRFPRILNWRKDKKPEECDTLDRVRELYESSLNLTAPHD